MTRAAKCTGGRLGVPEVNCGKPSAFAVNWRSGPMKAPAFDHLCSEHLGEWLVNSGEGGVGGLHEMHITEEATNG